MAIHQQSGNEWLGLGDGGPEASPDSVVREELQHPEGFAVGARRDDLRVGPWLIVHTAPPSPDPETGADSIAKLTGREHLAFFDAISPIVDSETIDMSIAYKASRYGNSIDGSPAGWDKVTIGSNEHFRQDGRTVQMFAIKKTIRVLKKLQQEFADPDRRLHFVGHQANLRMLDAVCQRCEIPEELHHSSVVDFGNTGAAGAPGVVSMRWDEWQPRDDVALVGVGSGLTWSGHVYRFGEV